MRHTQRISTELRLLTSRYGESAVTWAPDYSWVQLRDFLLPPTLNKAATNVLLVIPDGYGYGVPYTELYVDPELRVRHGGAWREIPHYFDGRGYAPTPTIRDRNWRYLCLHMTDWRPQDNILTFLKQVQLFLGDPFHPRWERR